MLERKITIQNKLGIHARPASLLAKEAIKFKSQCFVIKKGNKFNCKSIMSILSMGGKQGEEVSLEILGEDEREAFESLIALFESNFGE
ncbi:HPr family phosphocarrier protein [Geosporobacter ferrireducens]|uniref:Phosphocarrier protein HPr n=1 Tax=Geosporobacter ferrireducens TaxID=1424294 RepID=A0A1D8GKL7_9FIRM|nr:HPr family phosphocarrier protein [Geosporobacter ferrireducens]AOT71456.1 serine kinase [Geosporobacter ferrireducens]MTI57764.1 HPr family phosphocarrier protein [Geosporobacter ferrireducens]